MIINVADAKANFSRLLSTVSIGKEEVVISKRDKPVAVLVSFDEYTRMHSGREDHHISTQALKKLPSGIDKYIGIVSPDELDEDYKQTREQYLRDKYI